MVEFFNRFNEYNKKINWLLFLFISIFTMGSWIDISGVWCELPLMVESLPERWRLPSILTLISQLGQIGPLLFLIGKFFFPDKFSNTNVILFILSIGASSCFLLSFFWNKTLIVFNEERSIFLYIFNFSLSLLDSISTLTFLPYIGEHFAKEYIIPHYIGESLSSLIPGLLAIVQGVGMKDECFNETIEFDKKFLSVNSTELEPISVRNVKFSVSVYFCLMGVLIFFSITSFSFIHFTNSLKKHRKVLPNTLVKINNKSQSYNIIDYTLKNIDLGPHGLYAQDELYKENKSLTFDEKKEIFIFMFLSFLSSFINYGYLPGVLTYSTIPYGINFLYLSINLTSICLPLSILFSIWSYEVKIGRIVMETLIPVLLSIYILFISIQSPCPPFLNYKYDVGGYLIVCCWVLTSCMFIRIRCLIATKLEKYGKNVLLALGIFSIVGQLIGGLIIYYCVDVLRLLKDKPKCSLEDLCVEA